MKWKDLLIDSYGAVSKTVERALDGLTREDVNWQPRPDCNSIGWTAWHLTRALDELISSITEEEQLGREIEDTWSQVFPTVGQRIVIALDEILQHVGQVCYIRGLLHGKGWQEL